MRDPHPRSLSRGERDVALPSPYGRRVGDEAPGRGTEAEVAVKPDNFKILKSQIFIFALAVLLLNDFLLKLFFHNFLTGKLSDFAGLFIFPLFWFAIFPSHKIKIYILTGILFFWWKCPLSQGVIDFWNGLGLIRIGRTVDFTDLIALVILPLSYIVASGKIQLKTVKLHPAFLLTLSSFAFIATSYRSDFDYNKEYQFSFSKDELVSRINKVNVEGIKNKKSNNLPLSVNYKNANHFVMERDNDTVFRHLKGYTDYPTKIDGRDTIYKIPDFDSTYINYIGIVHLMVPAKEYVKESKTSYCEQVDMKIRITGNDSASTLTLIKVYTSNCMGIFEKEAKKNEKGNLQKAFETEIVERVKD